MSLKKMLAAGAIAATAATGVAANEPTFNFGLTGQGQNTSANFGVSVPGVSATVQAPLHGQGGHGGSVTIQTSPKSSLTIQGQNVPGDGMSNDRWNLQFNGEF